MRRIVTALLLVFTLVPAAPALAAPWVEAPQGEWVGQYGADGFVLAGWDVGADLVDLPAGVSVSLDQGTRYQWDANTDDVRALEAPDEATHRATIWYDPVEIQAGLTFTDPYSGTIRLYSVDWDQTTRRQTVTVTTSTDGAQSEAIDASFNGGAWVEFPINVLAAETVSIAVTHGIFLGGPTAGAPLSVAAVPGDGSVDVSWSAPTTFGVLTSYNVYRSTTSGGPYDTPVSVTAPTTAYQDNTVSNGTTYYYVVTALESAVEGPASAEVSATPVAAAVWSEAPQGDWVGAYGADGFVLAGWDVGADLVDLPAGVSVSLDQGTRYRWNANTTDVRALAAPDEVTRRATIWYDPVEVQAGLTFAAPYSGTIRLYSLDWDTATRRQTVSVTTATDGLQSVAIDASFNGGAWVEFPINVLAAETVSIAVTHDGGAPHAVLSGIFLGGPTAGAPLSVAAVPGVGLVDVSWAAPTTGSPTGYNVYRSETSGGPYSVVDAATPLLAFTDTTVSNGTTYYYVVTALESAVEGPASAEVSATPTAGDVGWSQGVQGEWVGQYGADGFVLAGWDVGADLVDLPAGVSVSLDQGTRYRWNANTDDVRALEAPDEATHRATIWYHPVEVQAGLTFTDSYSGTIRLYSVDWDTATRRQTVTVSTSTDGAQSAAIDASFNGGAWVEVPINVLAAETISIAVTHDGGAAHAVLSGILGSSWVARLLGLR